jgi:hypothetical protein
MVAGVKPTDEPGEKRAAILGTWMHKGILDALKREYGIVPEVKLSSPLVDGNADALALPTGDAPAVLSDVKTVSTFLFDRRVEAGPPIEHLYQTHVYAWMLREGHIPAVSLRRLERAGWHEGVVPVERIELIYVCRDNGKEWRHSQDYDPSITAEALTWLADVYEVALDGDGPDALPRDYNGPGLAVQCDGCPFRTECWGEQPEPPVMWQANAVHTDEDAEAALADYLDAAAAEKDAKARKEKARAMLTGSDAGQYGGYMLTWRETSGRRSLDQEAVKETFKQAGLEVPYKIGLPSLTISVSRAK